MLEQISREFWCLQKHEKHSYGQDFDWIFRLCDSGWQCITDALDCVVQAAVGVWDQVQVGMGWGALMVCADWETVGRDISPISFSSRLWSERLHGFILLCFILFFFSIAIKLQCLKGWEAFLFFTFYFTDSWRVKRLSFYCHPWIKCQKRRRDWYMFSRRGSFCLPEQLQLNSAGSSSLRQWFSKCGPQALALLGNLLEMQILGSISDC